MPTRVGRRIGKRLKWLAREERSIIARRAGRFVALERQPFSIFAC